MIPQCLPSIADHVGNAITLLLERSCVSQKLEVSSVSSEAVVLEARLFLNQTRTETG